VKSMPAPPQQGSESTGSRLARELKEKPRKAAMLAIFLGASTWVWAGILLGGGRARPAAARGAVPPGLATPAAAATVHGAVQDYETAMERLQTWRGPLGLHLDHKDDLVQVVVPELPEIEEEEPFPGLESAAEEESRPPELTLTGTVLTGQGCWALFQGQRVKEGEAIGRYRVVAIRPREADVTDGRATWTLCMPGSGLGRPEPSPQEEE